MVTHHTRSCTDSPFEDICMLTVYTNRQWWPGPRRTLHFKPCRTDSRISSVSRCSQFVSPLNQHATRRPNLIFTQGPSSETSCHLHANRTARQEEKQEVKMSELPVKRTLTFWCLPSFVVRCDKKKIKNVSLQLWTAMSPKFELADGQQSKVTIKYLGKPPEPNFDNLL